MTPERSTVIDGHKIEEFYWAGDYTVYVDNHLVREDYDRACKLLANGENVSRVGREE